ARAPGSGPSSCSIDSSLPSRNEIMSFRSVGQGGAPVRVTTESDGDGARIASCRGLPSRPTSCGPTSPLSFGALGFSARPARRRGGTALYCQLLMSAPGLSPGARGLPRLLDRGMDDLAVPRGEGMPRHFPHTFLVAETITQLQEHRQDFERLGSHA